MTKPMRTIINGVNALEYIDLPCQMMTSLQPIKQNRKIIID